MRSGRIVRAAVRALRAGVHAGAVLALVVPAQAACKLTREAAALPGNVDLFRDASRSVAVYAAEVRRDDDGAPNAYHPCGANFADDGCPGGNFGLDHICSGVVVLDAKGKRVPPSEKNPVTKKNSSARCLQAFRDVQAAGYPECGQKKACIKSWPGIVRAERKPPVQGLQKQIPILRPAGSPFEGYYVSKTTLGRPDPAAPGGTAFIDARKIPYIVVPGSSVLTSGSWDFGSSTRADLALVIQQEDDGPLRAVFAVVADTGPADKTGEGSVALLGRLRGKPKAELDAERPRARALPGEGFEQNATYVLFKRSGELLKDAWPKRDLTAADVRAAGAKALATVGGLASLADCAGIPSDVTTIEFAAD